MFWHPKWTPSNGLYTAIIFDIRYESAFFSPPQLSYDPPAQFYITSPAYLVNDFEIGMIDRRQFDDTAKLCMQGMVL